MWLFSSPPKLTALTQLVLSSAALSSKEVDKSNIRLSNSKGNVFLSPKPFQASRSMLNLDLYEISLNLLSRPSHSTKKCGGLSLENSNLVFPNTR